MYEELLHSVVDACDTIGISADPVSVTTDFKVAVMNAIRMQLGDHMRVRGCFFHLCQSTWRKVQELGLVDAYKDTGQ